MLIGCGRGLDIMSSPLTVQWPGRRESNIGVCKMLSARREVCHVSPCALRYKTRSVASVRNIHRLEHLLREVSDPHSKRAMYDEPHLYVIVTEELPFLVELPQYFVHHLRAEDLSHQLPKSAPCFWHILKVIGGRVRADLTSHQGAKANSKGLCWRLASRQPTCKLGGEPFLKFLKWWQMPVQRMTPSREQFNVERSHLEAMHHCWSERVCKRTLEGRKRRICLERAQ
jgi:hypothetical protein